MATHPSILGWRNPWTEGPGRLQSIGLQRVRHHGSDSAQHFDSLRTDQEKYLKGRNEAASSTS